MTVRTSLSDAHWQILQPLFPSHEPHPEGGRPRHDDRPLLEAIIWRQRTGCPWRDLPDEFPAWQTVYTRWRQWTDQGILKEVFETLLDLLQAEGLLDHDLWLIDSTTARAQRAAAGAPKASKKTTARA